MQGLVQLGEVPPSDPILSDSTHSLSLDRKMEPGIDRLVSNKSGWSPWSTFLLSLPLSLLILYCCILFYFIPSCVCTQKPGNK